MDLRRRQQIAMDAASVTSVYLTFTQEQKPDGPASAGPGHPDAGALPDMLPASGDCAFGIAALALVLAILAGTLLAAAVRARRSQCAVRKRRSGAGGLLGAALIAATFASGPAAYAFALDTGTSASGSGTSVSDTQKFVATPPEAWAEPERAEAVLLGADSASRAISWAYPESGVYRITNTSRTADLVGRNTSDDYAYVYLGVGDGDCYFHVKQQTSTGWYSIQAMHNGTYLKAWESASGVFGNPGTWFVPYTGDHTLWAFQYGGYGGGLGISNKVWGNGNYLDIVGNHDGYYDNRVNLSSYASCPDASGRGWRLEEIPFSGTVELKGTPEEGRTIDASVASGCYKVGTMVCSWYLGDSPGAQTTLIERHTVNPGTDSIRIPDASAGMYLTCVLSDDQYRGSVSKSIGPIAAEPTVSISATPTCAGTVSGKGEVDFPVVNISNESDGAVVVTGISFEPNPDAPRCAIRVIHGATTLFTGMPQGSMTFDRPVRMEIGGKLEFRIEATGDWKPSPTTGESIGDVIGKGHASDLFRMVFSAEAAQAP